MDKSEIPIFRIPNKICEKVGLAAAWRPINNLTIFPSQRVESRDRSTESSTDLLRKQTQCVYHVQQQVILVQTIFRKFINETNGIFIALQSERKAENRQHSTVKISRQYRSAIRACLQDLEIEHSKSDANAKDQCKHFITIFYSVEYIWHLCEILYLSSTVSDGYILNELLEWIRFHFPKHEKKATILLSEYTVHSDENEEFWSTVFGCLLHGRLHIVRMLLKLHSNYPNNALQLVDSYLQSFPIFDANEGISSVDFLQQRAHWILDVQCRIDAQQFQAMHQLNFIMKIMVGDEKAWHQFQSYCDTWYEYMAAWLFFNAQTVKCHELGKFAQQSIEKILIQRDSLNCVDRTLLSAMEFDIPKVLQEIQQIGDSGWFLTHFADLLKGTRWFKMDSTETINDKCLLNELHESFLLDYGTLMMDHKSLWQVGLTYLDACNKRGTEVIAIFLPKLELDSELKARKVLHEAITRNLSQVAEDICKMQAIKSRNRGQLANALMWAIRSGNSVFISIFANEYLLKYSQTDDSLADINTLVDLGPCILINDALTLLAKYCEFARLIQEENYKSAATLLISLFKSKIVPNYFWKVLFKHATLLLERDEHVFSSEDIYAILQYLHENEASVVTNDRIRVIQLASVKSLACCIIQESTSSNGV